MCLSAYSRLDCLKSDLFLSFHGTSETSGRNFYMLVVCAASVDEALCCSAGVSVIAARSRQSTLINCIGANQFQACRLCLPVSAWSSIVIPSHWTLPAGGFRGSALPIVYHTQQSAVGDRAFPVAIAPVWNDLPQHSTSAPSYWFFTAATWRTCLATAFHWLHVFCLCLRSVIVIVRRISLSYHFIYLRLIKQHLSFSEIRRYSRYYWEWIPFCLHANVHCKCRELRSASHFHWCLWPVSQCRRCVCRVDGRCWPLRLTLTHRTRCCLKSFHVYMTVALFTLSRLYRRSSVLR